MNLHKQLEELGFYRVRNGLEEINAEAARMAAAAGRPCSGAPCFQTLPSFIPARAAQRRRPAVLSVDIGGSSTKVGVRLVDQAQAVHWLLLFERENETLRAVLPGLNSIEAFCTLLARSTAAALAACGLDARRIAACGIVWSNPIENRRDAEQGVLGVIVKRAIYSKSEWFNVDLVDGVDIGLLFLEAFNAEGFTLRRIVISNDTTLTMKAAPGADAGMVASTGLNGTLVKRLSELGLAGDEEVICNAEMGRMPIEARFLSAGDTLRGGRPADEIEYLSSGAFLPVLFVRHLLRLAESGVREFAGAAGWLRDRRGQGEDELTAAELTALLFRPEDFFRKRPSFPDTPALRECLAQLARELFGRSAALASVVAAATVSNRPPTAQPRTVALDSRLARENKLFWELLQRETVRRTPAPCMKLLTPLAATGGSISVPMQGAANALDAL